MENTVDALKMAFAIFVFTIAISLAIYMFTKARETANIVLQSSDVTKYMEYTDLSDINSGISIEDDRIVGLETIIPTLYKYYKENYTVIFLKSDGITPLDIYETQTEPTLWSEGYTNKYYSDNQDLRVCSFDVDEETRRHEPWTGSNEKIKSNIDYFLKGGTYTYNVSSSYYPEGKIVYNYGQGFIKEHQQYKFRESIGEYTYNDITSQTDGERTSGITNVKQKKKRVIIYTLMN